MHLQRMAGLHNRRMDTAAIGTTIENPNIDYAKLAQSMGVHGEGPITDPNAIGPALSRAPCRGQTRRAGIGRCRYPGTLKRGIGMRFVISIMLLLIASVAFAQEAPPAGSAERGANSYRKYMCYTCHGTVGQGATAGVGSKLAPGHASVPGFRPSGAHAPPRYAGVSQGICQRSGVGRYVRLSLNGQAVSGGKGYSVAEIRLID